MQKHPSLAFALCVSASVACAEEILPRNVPIPPCAADRTVVREVWPTDGLTTYVIKTDGKGAVASIAVRRTLRDRGAPDSTHEAGPDTLAHPGMQEYWLRFVREDPEVKKCLTSLLAPRGT